MALGLRGLRALGVAWTGAVALALAVGLLLIGAGPTEAAPTPSPAPSSPAPISLLPGILPPVTLPTIILPSLTLPSTAPILGGVVSTVNGLGGAVQRTLNGVLVPAAASPAPSTPTDAAPGSPTSTAGPAPVHPDAGADPSAAPRSGTPHHSKQPTATARRVASRLAGSNAARAARTGVTVADAPALTKGPAALVERATDAVMHPGRALLAIIAITVLCALGMLALVTSLGRRELPSA